ncbi:unnamed protein product [Eruca vesicaria subsp. sativa]|uniref:Uncharacterized protein n=1 Tax=Eruca vesicaria subsp. sativa TaxID=29727 RepID=A0ABC8LAS6_ERUVS|nr:unnamed protein product [Eruca vesicaria subsp. sativa]
MEPPTGVLSSLWRFIIFIPYFTGLLLLSIVKDSAAIAITTTDILQKLDKGGGGIQTRGRWKRRISLEEGGAWFRSSTVN